MAHFFTWPKCIVSYIVDVMEALPFLPYGRQTVDEDDIAEVVEVLRSDFITSGPVVTKFERMIADRVGARYAVAVANGTAALHTACFAAGIGEGDQVIVPAITFLATANCARYLNAEPVFADVDPDSGLILQDEIEKKLRPETRAVIPVHLAGHPVDIHAISTKIDNARVVILEDAAHALGSVDQSFSIGSCRHSKAVIFSFHPVKHITTGEGGVVVTNDDLLYQRARTFRNHGMVHDQDKLTVESPGPWFYEQQFLGYNYRITDFQSALGMSQLKKLELFVERRRFLAQRYRDLLKEVRFVTPTPSERLGCRSAYHLFPVLIDFEQLGTTRAETMKRLRELDVGTQVHYIPVPAQPYYRERGWNIEDFPGARRYYERTLSLPLFPAMMDSDVDRVVESLKRVLNLDR